MFDTRAPVALNTELLADAVKGLSAPVKHLSPKWFYDQRGSELFEEITMLDEYYPTRTEAAILLNNAHSLVGLVPDGGALVELGSGASVKTRTLLDAGAHFGAYVPIDISQEFLMATAKDLGARYPDLPIHPVVGDFNAEIALPLAVRDLPKVGFFPGSTIGNLEPKEAIGLLSWARDWPGMQRFILGADLIKGQDELIAAYDDARGVTAAFNLNLLVRLNREAGATFDITAFDHEARWMGDRIEMHLVARNAHTVTLGGQSIAFEKGESIHTESCRKYTHDDLESLARASGWRLEHVLTDARNRFAVAVLAQGDAGHSG